MMNEETFAKIEGVPWTSNKPPQKVLAIRLQAMGDMVISLPYLQYLRRSLPQATVFDFLTLEEVMDIPQKINLFNNVYAIKGGRSFKKQFLYTCSLLPQFFFSGYDVVLDLQNNRLSNMIRKAAHPKAWCEFDRFSPNAAGERNRKTIEAAGFANIRADNNFIIKQDAKVEQLLKENGWNTESDLIILNPAGAFENRHWPADRFIEFAQLWLQQYPSTQFMAVGIDKIKEKAALFKNALGNSFINLVNKTAPSQAFALVQKTKFVLSEDSGLMHMAWVSGIPTLALFGSTRSDWTRPLGTCTDFLDSSDLACGNCMQELCRFTGDEKNFCMTRYTAPYVFERAMQLMQRIEAKGSITK